jgi:hypothetical protein
MASPLFTELTSDCLSSILHTFFIHPKYPKSIFESFWFDYRNIHRSPNDIIIVPHYLFILKFVCKKIHQLCHISMINFYNDGNCSNLIVPMWILFQCIVNDEENLIQWLMELDVFPVNLRNKAHDRIINESLHIWSCIWEYAGYRGDISFLNWCLKKYPDENWCDVAMEGAAKRNNFVAMEWALDNMDNWCEEKISSDGSFEKNVLDPIIQYGNIECLKRLISRVDFDEDNNEIHLATTTRSGTKDFFRIYDEDSLADLYKKAVKSNHICVLEWLKNFGVFRSSPWSKEMEGNCIETAFTTLKET